MTPPTQKNDLSETYQTKIYTTALDISEPTRGICEVDEKGISIRKGGESHTIEYEDIQDITIGTPPNRFSDEFDRVFGLKFKHRGFENDCLIKHDEKREDVFRYEIFAKVINGAKGVLKWGVKKGGQKKKAKSRQIQAAVKPEGIVFKHKNDSLREISLGDIVDIHTEVRTVGDKKRKAIQIDHVKDKTVLTSYVYLINRRISHVLNRYLRKEYSNLQEEISNTNYSREETQMIIGYYTTQSIKETMNALTKGDKEKFESIYESALEHGLVTPPDNGVGLTQKGRMLANTEIETVNT